MLISYLYYTTNICTYLEGKVINVMNYGLPDKMMHGIFDLEQPEITHLVADKNVVK